MAKIIDRTEDFKDAVRASALSFGYTEAKVASLMASFIMHKPPQRSPFIKTAIKTMENINELEQFIIRHRRDYINLNRTTKEQRDNIEHEVSIFVNACKEQIDILKNSICVDESTANSRKWLRDDRSHADVIAHKHGVVLILSERLHSVTTQFDKLRSVRIQDTMNRAVPRRKMPKKSVAGTVESFKSGISESGEDKHLSSSETFQVQDQLLDDETRALQVIDTSLLHALRALDVFYYDNEMHIFTFTRAELTNILDAVEETETKMVEVSALNNVLSTHVSQQVYQIEQLYDQAVEATKNVELGNKELTQAIKRNSSSTTFMILFFFVIIFSVLFLDWYS